MIEIKKMLPSIMSQSYVLMILYLVFYYKLLLFIHEFVKQYLGRLFPFILFLLWLVEIEHLQNIFFMVYDETIKKKLSKHMYSFKRY